MAIMIRYWTDCVTGIRHTIRIVGRYVPPEVGKVVYPCSKVAGGLVVGAGIGAGAAWGYSKTKGHNHNGHGYSGGDGDHGGNGGGSSGGGSSYQHSPYGTEGLGEGPGLGVGAYQAYRPTPGVSGALEGVTGRYTETQTEYRAENTTDPLPRGPSTAVPEPGSLILLLGAAILAGLNRLYRGRGRTPK